MKKHILTYLIIAFSLLYSSCSDGDMAAMPSGTGQGGSMARFAVVGNYLYVVDSRKLHVYDVNDPSTPVRLKDIEIGFNIETIFPYQEKLFIGSMDGMHIYDIVDPQNPLFLSTYRHITSCDPVVVQGNLAYVTLRTDNSCPRGSNQLDIIDVSDPSLPVLVNSYQMDSPFGLGIDGNTLFVGEGQNGLTVLNVEDPYDVKEIGSVEDMHAFDVIVRNNNLILTGKDGVFQFDYSEADKLKLKSSLNISDCN